MGVGFERGVMANRRSEGRKKKEKKKEVAGDDDWGGLREAEGRGQPFNYGTECGDARKQEREHLIGQMRLEVGTKRRQRAPVLPVQGIHRWHLRAKVCLVCWAVPGSRLTTVSKAPPRRSTWQFHAIRCLAPWCVCLIRHMVFAVLYIRASLTMGSLAQTVTEPNQDDEAEAGGDGWVGCD